MTNLPHDRRIELAGLHNLRDLGGHTHATGVVSWRRFWRSDSLHDLDAGGMRHLVRLGLGTVIDLRQTGEAAAQPNPFSRNNDTVAYRNVSLFEGLDLSAPEIVDAEDPLLTLYCHALEQRHAQFAAVMRLIAEASDGTILFHCTVGKDRTGMVAAMLLRLAGVRDADIVADYAETRGNIGPILAGLRARAQARNWDVALLSRYWRSDAATMQGFLDHLDATHGGIAPYLLAAGLTRGELQAIQRRLTQPAPSGPEPRLPLAALSGSPG